MRLSHQAHERERALLKLAMPTVMVAQVGHTGPHCHHSAQSPVRTLKELKDKRH